MADLCFSFCSKHPYLVELLDMTAFQTFSLVSLSPEKLQNSSSKFCSFSLGGRSNNVGVGEAAFESIASIMGTCNVDDTLNSEYAVNTVMELFIKRYEGFEVGLRIFL
ncbi:unnamed protein product [Sphagnum balticum]